MWVIALGVAAALVLVGAGLTFTGAGRTVISAVYHFLEFYSGVFSLVSLSIAVMVGLAATDRIVLLVRHRVLLQAVHRATASTAMIFLCVHIFTKIVESHASVVDVVVPFVASHKVFYIGLGTIASYLMFLVTWTGIIRGRFAGSAHPGLWRAVHASAYLSWIVALFHGLNAGRHAKTWVTVSYVVCVLLVVLASLVRLSVSWGRRMRSPKAQTTGTIKAIGKPVNPRLEPALSTVARTLDDDPFTRRTTDDDPFARRTVGDDPFARRVLDGDATAGRRERDGDDPFARRVLDGDATAGRRERDGDDPFARRILDDDAAAAGRRDRGDPSVRHDPPAGRPGRGGHRSELDEPLSTGEPGVEWYDEAGNHSFAAGPVFSSRSERARGPRGSHSAPDDDDAPLTGQPVPRLSYLDDVGASRMTPDVSYRAPEEEPAFPESAYEDGGGGMLRSGTGAFRQVRARDSWDRDSWGDFGTELEDRGREGWDRDVPGRDGLDRDEPGGWRRAGSRGSADGRGSDVRGSDGRGSAGRDSDGRDSTGRDSDGRDSAGRGSHGRGYDEAGNQRGYAGGRRAETDYPTGGYLDTRSEPERPARRPRTPVDDLLAPEPAAEPPKRRRRSLAELPAAPAEPVAAPGPAKPAEDISDEEFWAHMRGDVLR